MKRNFKLVLEYDGTAYQGWQRRGELPTIQRILEEAIGRITKESITLYGSGRTDAGVHALQQVANFKTESRIPVGNLLRGINSLLPEDIAIKETQEVDEDFHSRYSAKSKSYLYRIFNSPIRSPLERNSAWFVRASLDLEKMPAFNRNSLFSPGPGVSPRKKKTVPDPELVRRFRASLFLVQPLCQEV